MSLYRYRQCLVLGSPGEKARYVLSAVLADEGNVLDPEGSFDRRIADEPRLGRHRRPSPGKHHCIVDRVDLALRRVAALLGRPFADRYRCGAGGFLISLA